MPTYTLCGCTIEVARGGQSARATRNVDAEGRIVQPPEAVEFGVIAEPDAPTPQVQAEYWAKGMPEWKPLWKPIEGLRFDGAAGFVPAAESATDEGTEIDEQDDAQ